MPRPHSLPRTPDLTPPTEPFAPFPHVGVTRQLTSVNLSRTDKAVFDALQSWWSFREGRALQQCEVFSMLMEAALKNGGHPRIRGFRKASPPSP